jgi:hypothetical protein
MGAPEGAHPELLGERQSCDVVTLRRAPFKPEALRENLAEQGARQAGEADRCSQKLAALVEHELLDHLVGSQQH